MERFHIENFARDRLEIVTIAFGSAFRPGAWRAIFGRGYD